MIEGYWKLFFVSHSQLALWYSGYNSWLRISRLWVQIQEFLFMEEKPSLISLFYIQNKKIKLYGNET